MEIDMEIDNKPGIQGGEWCAPHRGTPWTYQTSFNVHILFGCTVRIFAASKLKTCFLLIFHQFYHDLSSYRRCC
jgi:hypothetical protein